MIEKKPILLVFNFSLSTLWSIYLIKNETNSFPTLLHLSGMLCPWKKAIWKRVVEGVISNIAALFISIHYVKIASQDAKSNLDPLLVQALIENSYYSINNSIFPSYPTAEFERMEREMHSAYCKSIAFPPNQDYCLYVFNGRWAPAFVFCRGLMDVGYISELRYIEIVRSATEMRIFSSKEQPWLSRCHFELAQASRELYSENALSFFYNRRKGLDKDGRAFVSQQVETYSDTYDIVYYTSSLEEQIGFDYSRHEVLRLGKYSLRELAFFQNNGFRCCIRVHPNLKFKAINDIKLWRLWLNQLRSIGVIVFDQHSAVSSYHLFEKSRLVFSVGSTIGAEAAFAGKPVLDFKKSSLACLTGCSVAYDRDLALSILKGETNISASINSLKTFGCAMSLIGKKVPSWLLPKV